MKWADILKRKRWEDSPEMTESGYGKEGSKEWFNTPLPGQLAPDDWTLPKNHPQHESNRTYGELTEQQILDMMERIKGVKSNDYIPTKEDMEKYKELADELEFRRADEEDWRFTLFSPEHGKTEDYTQGEEQWTEERLRGPKVKDLGDEE
jgi:hypothetical protein